jgi:hypothetical protein
MQDDLKMARIVQKAAKQGHRLEHDVVKDAGPQCEKIYRQKHETRKDSMLRRQKILPLEYRSGDAVPRSLLSYHSEIMQHVEDPSKGHKDRLRLSIDSSATTRHSHRARP